MIGPVGSYRGFGLQDHSCWVHGDRGDYRPRLTGFFREGLDRGLRVAYLGPGTPGSCENTSTVWLIAARCWPVRPSGSSPSRRSTGRGAG